MGAVSKSDERILGGSDFVASILEQAEEAEEKRINISSWELVLRMWSKSGRDPREGTRASCCGKEAHLPPSGA